MAIPFRQPCPRRVLRRLVRWTSAVGIAALVLLGMITLPGGWRLHRLLAERDALLAELDRAEPGWRWDDLVPAKVPDEHNGALKVLGIAKLIPNDWLRMPDEVAQARPRNTQ